MPKRVLDVLAYFLRNPRAANTLEGVARWRLLEEAVHRGVGEAEDALGWLVEHDFLLQEGGKRAEPLFRLNEEKIEDAKELVRRSGPPRRAGKPRP